ncbi:hypothetical protein ABRZ03_02245 [Castellaniella ginsengisoli]|uniref:ABC transporter permease n=1 Tax=Castellaniella ginsengisoli TaxID=546114 RepID=A0AB39EIR2_9BURK
MIWLQALWGRVWPYVAGAAGIVVGLFFVRQSGKAAGRQEARIDQLEQGRKARRDADANAEKIRAMDDDDLVREFDRLRDRRR